jgi:hypothetical protein
MYTREIIEFIDYINKFADSHFIEISKSLIVILLLMVFICVMYYYGNNEFKRQ